MPAYDLIQKTFQKEYKGLKEDGIDYKKILSSKFIDWRRETQSIVRVEKPTNIARARKLGYKAKEGFIVVRVRVRKGSGLHKRPKGARRPKRMAVKKLTRKKSIQRIAEERASKKFPNCEVLNSYFIGDDGTKKYFEVILLDTSNPSILSDKDVKWIANKSQTGRSERGLTSAAKKGRGLHKKGFGSEQTRPSKKSKMRKKIAKRKTRKRIPKKSK